MKYTAECPSCEGEFEIAGPTTAEAGLRCPRCQTQFTPQSIDQVEDDELEEDVIPISQREKWSEYESLKHDAGGTFGFGIFFLVAAIILGALAFFNEEHFTLLIVAGGFLMSLATICLLFSQLLHIRAGLEKLNNK
jgi:hypothetical protein